MRSLKKAAFNAVPILILIPAVVTSIPPNTGIVGRYRMLRIQ
jgi:hypothetical protein